MPWHKAVTYQFSNEADVAQALKLNVEKAGVYYLPYEEEDHKPGEVAAFVNVLPNGFDTNMGKMMAIGLLGNIFSALLVFFLLLNISGLHYWSKVRFVALVGLSVGFVSHFPYWNWFGFSNSYIPMTILDTLIAWILAGLVMANFLEDPMS